MRLLHSATLRRSVLFFSVLMFATTLFSQVSNNEKEAGLININLPKTPESSGMEKQGKIPVNEATGQVNISIPLYAVSGRMLELPISLSYDASGVKVSQESSWVGLGFDVVAGGRITVETRGSIDNDGVTPGLFSQGQLKYGLAKLFNRLGDSSALASFTYASTCKDCDTVVTLNIPDHEPTMAAMSDFGVGDPDIFRANFLGNSFTFYYDVISDSLRFLGEKNLFDIAHTKDGFQRITAWTITDNMGIRYFFDQKEQTTMTLPAFLPLYDNTSTSAWLLTKILHPNGDSIKLHYTLYGNAYPVSEPSSSMMFKTVDRSLAYSSPQEENQVIQKPAYLTKIESVNTQVDFVLSSRDDIKGAGSKKLDEIVVRNRMDSSIIKKIDFAYSYFDASLIGTCFQSAHDSIGRYMRLRLKLDAVTPNDSSTLVQTPYHFYYIGGSYPHKRSFQQDYWGYYNGVGGNNIDPCSALNLIPNTGAGNAHSYAPLDGYNVSRLTNGNLMQMMTMDSMVYPTGGSVKLFYEPHVSTRYNEGGGLRIKKIVQHASGRIASNTEYTYQPGMYMGKVNHLRKEYELHYERTDLGFPNPGYDQDKVTIFSHGLSNDHDMLIIYPYVSIKETNEKGQSNGRVQKVFKTLNPYMFGYGVLGFNIAYAHWPTTPQGGYGDMSVLYPESTAYPPTPPMQMEGMLQREDYYDSNDSLVKRIEYFHRQVEYTKKFYRAQVMDLRLGGSNSLPNGGYGREFHTNGARRFTVFVSPGKSFYTVLDSVVEKTYHNNIPVTIKKAYQYNKFYQQEYETVYNSDGTQTISRTVTSLGLEPKYTLSTASETADIYSLRQNHIYDLPIEQTSMLRTLTGDTLVTHSRINYYQGTLPKKVFVMETVAPVAFGAQFVPLYYNYTGYPGAPGGSSMSLSMDSRYKLYSTAHYSAQQQIRSLESLAGKNAYIWDEYFNDVLAQVANADSSDIAYTSFETNAKGRWSYNAALTSSQTLAPTGAKGYTLTNGNVTISGLNATRTYIISYWSKNGAQAVNGSSSTAGATIHGWTYYEHVVTNPAGGNLAVSGAGTIDELRLYPRGALMTTYAHQPLIGMSAQADVRNKISYYEYDVIGRLARIRDERRYIVSQFEYKFQDIFNYPYGNQAQSQLFVKNDCASGYVGTNLSYAVPANKYGSFISVNDANRKALAEIANSETQARVNATGSCNPYYSLASCCGYGTSASLSLTGTGSVNFSIAVYGSSSPYGQIGTLSGVLFIPSTTRYVNTTSGGNTYVLVFHTNGNVNIMGSTMPGGGVILTGTYAL